jgi:two-component system chemotaxis response regulator CheY
MTTVLLVDASLVTRLSISAVLVKAGMTVETAVDGRDALDRLDGALEPDLIITDVAMSPLDGLAFVREARRTVYPSGPILMFTTMSDRGKRNEARSAGATGWIVKPVGVEALLGVIRQVLDLPQGGGVLPDPMPGR